MATRQRRYAGGLGKRPVQAADILAAALESRHLAKKINEYGFFPCWPQIVGEEFAQVSKPEKITRGKVLIVRVVDDVWAQELTLHKHELLDRLFEAQTGAVIEDIQFVTGDPKLRKRR